MHIMQSAGDDRARPTAQALRLCASALKKGREAVVTALIVGDRQPRDNRFEDAPDLFRRRVGEGLDLLIRHLDGQEGFAALYAGQRNVELFRLERTREDNLDACQRAVAEDGAVLHSFLAPRVGADALVAFDRAYAAVTKGLVTHASHHVRTLFVGDCLLSEIMAFLVGPLMDDSVSIEPFPINARDPGQLRQIMSGLSTKSFDVIFFSPFSHARLPELEALMNPARALMATAEIETLVDSILDQTRALLDELADRFECPIFIHNAGLVSRAGGAAKALVRLALTRRRRRYAESRINRWIADYVSLKNTNTFRHLFVLDEAALVRTFGRRALGQFLNASDFQHATVLSQRLALHYHDRIWAVAHLLGKKLVVCDLDNTLWDGVIGEGAVVHFAQRQASLKRLKDHGGVVLSIASKNEMSNVRFDGGVLSMEDFVAPQVSWGPKAAAFAKLKSTLNLQTRHMVFVDDREDERALVREAFADVLTLDACDPRVWARLALWADMSFGSSDVDRTRMYREQALRDTAIDTDAQTQAAPDVAALKKLGLVISIGSAQRGDLKRVAELVNRTNQWNLCGSRTSYEQVRTWHDSPRAQVLVARAADRFGDMGTVCVAVVTEGDGIAEIPVFVLSCRVFGYGVESAMLSEIVHRCGIGSRHQALVGHHRPNPQNHPCRNMYADHGFTAQDGSYRWAGMPPLPSVPWAELRSE